MEANSLQALIVENEKLKRENQVLQANLRAVLQLSSPITSDSSASSSPPSSPSRSPSEPVGKLTIVVFGASGDLASKKTFPALFSLFYHKLIPDDVLIAGFARSHMEHVDFVKKISQHFDKQLLSSESGAQARQAFLERCFYKSCEGGYTNVSAFQALDQELQQRAIVPSNRIFYFALPPDAYVDVATSIKASKLDQPHSKQWMRAVIEKPFGHDLQSSNALQTSLSALFDEQQIYRIDHYLGKEMVQNLLCLRFANSVFEPLFNSQHISSVQITFKEPFGIEGFVDFCENVFRLLTSLCRRGGAYFDASGIIRDVIQNHLIQILALFAMEPPVSLSAEDIRNEKTRLLRCIPPVHLDDVVIGQYLGNEQKPAYRDVEGVAPDSRTPTFACTVLHIRNARWAGCPFILKAGKALNERKTEIRVQFRESSSFLFGNAQRNELVLRVQPDEAICLSPLLFGVSLIFSGHHRSQADVQATRIHLG